MRNTILFLFAVGLLFSCSSEAVYPLNGEWNLVYVSCECAPIDLEIGEHIWNFNVDNEELLVVNNVTEELNSVYTLLETGAYNIVATDSTVTIQNREFDYYFRNGRLYLADEPESDGPLITFIR